MDCPRRQTAGLNAQMFCSFLDGTKSAVEMTAVANATGLVPQAQGLAFPACGTAELASRLRPAGAGGLLEHGGTLEVVSSLHLDGSAVHGDLRWGVYVTIAAADRFVAGAFGTTGSRPRATGRWPRSGAPAHLVGLELGVSVARARSRASRPESRASPIAEVACRAKRDLRAGETLDGEGGEHVYGVLRGDGSQARARCRWALRAARGSCATSRAAPRSGTTTSRSPQPGSPCVCMRSSQARSRHAQLTPELAGPSLTAIPAGSSPNPFYGFRDHPRQEQFPPVGSVGTDKPRRAPCASAPVPAGVHETPRPVRKPCRLPSNSLTVRRGPSGSFSLRYSPSRSWLLPRRRAASRAARRCVALHPGEQGPAVKKLQRMLAGLGYPIKPDGQFGPHTATMVRTLRADAGLDRSARVTKRFLNVLRRAQRGGPGDRRWLGIRRLRLGAQGKDVRLLQNALTQLGYPAVTDGAFGPATRQSVRLFERAAGLRVDGVLSRREVRTLKLAARSGHTAGAVSLRGTQAGNVTSSSTSTSASTTTPGYARRPADGPGRTRAARSRADRRRRPRDRSGRRARRGRRDHPGRQRDRAHARIASAAAVIRTGRTPATTARAP